MPAIIDSVVSLNGFRLEIHFSDPVNGDDPDLLDPNSYTLTPLLGGAPLEASSVEIGEAGVLSVLLSHSGTTLGGQYRVTASGLSDAVGDPLGDLSFDFLALGTNPVFEVAQADPETGSALVVTFSEPMLSQGEEPGIEETDSYLFSSDPDYPIDLLTLTAEQQSPTEVYLTVKGQTSIDYTLTVGPAFAFSFDTTDGIQNAQRVDVGPGSVTTGASYLLLGRPLDEEFSLEWQDQSGLLVPLVSTFRMDCTFDFSAATFSAGLEGSEVADIVFQDGTPGNGILVRVTLQQDGAGVDQVRVRSGAWDETLEADWGNQVHTLSLVRNLKAGIVTVLRDDYPLFTAAVAGVTADPETQAGIRFTLLSGAWETEGVRLHSVHCTASQTVYTETWNFIHDGEDTFEGSAALTRDSFWTRRGPLVKSWGDATPATVQDVSVKVNGTEVEVVEVNPYTGLVRVAPPIPLLPFGDPQANISVDYQWFKNPVMEFNALNTPGLVLNKWDRPTGHHDPPAHGDQVQEPTRPKGAVDPSRFPMSVVLGPLTRQTPLFIGHRYLGFERAYSALLNSPTTLLLNQAPGRASVPGFSAVTTGTSVAYEGLVRPSVASPAWVLKGNDLGGVDHGEGTFTVIDAKTGPFDPDNPTAVVYHRGVGLETPSSVHVVARLQASTGGLFDSNHPGSGDVSSSLADGVFTGVGFGFHDTRYMYLVGLLLINDVEHVGLLLNPQRPHEKESWSIGPHATLSASSQTKGDFLTPDVPLGFKTGSRFQILTGTQAGVYTATHVIPKITGVTTVTFSPALPEPWDIYGNKYPTATFETRFTAKPFTYRLDIDTEQQVAELRVSGETRGSVVTIDGNVPALPAPGGTALLIPQELTGQMFWGSLSRQAASRATWSFVRYGVIPESVFQSGHAVVINTEMEVLPENDTSKVWFPTGGAGQTLIKDGTLLLKSVAESPGIDLSFGYQRVEPFFIPDAIVDVSLNVQLDTGTLGAGDITLYLDDTQRKVLLKSLLYVEDGLTPYTFRRLINLPVSSFIGFITPSLQGWGNLAGNSLSGTIQGHQFTTLQDSSSRGGWGKPLDWQDTYAPAEDEGRVLEARLKLVSTTANANGDTGILFGCQLQSDGGFALVQVEITGTEIRLRSDILIQSYAFEPSGFHTYRVLIDRIGDTVTLLVDDEVQAPSVALSDFDGTGTNNTQVFFGAFGRDINNLLDDELESKVEWQHVHCHAQAPQAALRTLGVFKGEGVATSDPFDINNYEIPRTDSSTAPNAWQTGPVIEEMDWREPLEVRVYRDPNWGVSVLRPDLDPPPYYVAEDGTAGRGFLTETTEPSAGWINVEYLHLPLSQGSSLGNLGFGCFDSRGVNQSRWDWVRYRVFRHPTDDRIAPEHMLLNQFNVISSGERTQDTTLERAVIQTLDKTRLTLLPTHMYAKAIYKVLDGNTVWTSDQWSFDPASQLLSLLFNPDTGEQREFSSEHASVTVLFIPGNPVTSTYLANQPWLDSVTLLNEGTPPVPKSQVGTSEIEILEDPQRTLVHRNRAGTLYDHLDFFEADNAGETGLIAGICERGPGTGFSGFSQGEGEDIFSPEGEGDPLGGAGHVAGHFATGAKVGLPVGAEVHAFSGTQFWEEHHSPRDEEHSQEGGMPGGILFASGGSFVNPVVDEGGEIKPGVWVAGGGVLGPGSAVLYPTFPARGPIGGDRGRIYKRTDWFLRLRAVMRGDQEIPLEEDLSTELSDSTAPSQSDFWSPNPDGVFHEQGAALGILNGAGDYSRYGPWGGLNALTPVQDSGVFVLGVPYDGMTVKVWDRVALDWVVFTGRAAPALPEDFALAPNPHEALAESINTLLGEQYTAQASLDLSANPQVTVTTVTPTSTLSPAYLATGDPTAAYLRHVIPYPGDSGLLYGGAGISQSSLLAGGETTLNALGYHTPSKGMVALGGQTLPQGSKLKLTFTPA